MATSEPGDRYSSCAREIGEFEPFEPITCRDDARPKTGTEFRGELSVGAPCPKVYVSSVELEPHRRYTARFEVATLDGVGQVVVVRDPEPLTDP